MSPAKKHLMLEAVFPNAQSMVTSQPEQQPTPYFKFRLLSKDPTLPRSRSNSILMAELCDVEALKAGTSFESENDLEDILGEYQMALSGPTFEALQRFRPDLFHLVIQKLKSIKYEVASFYMYYLILLRFFAHRYCAAVLYSRECCQTRRSSWLRRSRNLASALRCVAMEVSCFYVKISHQYENNIQ